MLMMGFLHILSMVALFTGFAETLNTQDWPSLVFKELETVEIPCLPQAKAYAYIWTNGAYFNKSIEVASIADGIPSQRSNKYKVKEDGHLVIYNITVREEGMYFCRTASDEGQCLAGVTVHVQAENEGFSISIDDCTTNERCVISPDQSTIVSLTCTAEYVSSSTELKWYDGHGERNGTRVTTSVDNNHWKNIEHTITVIYNEPISLTCQAVDGRVGDSGGRFAQVQLETNAIMTSTSPVGWIVTTFVMIVALVIVVGVIILKEIIQRKNKALTDKDTEQTDQLLKIKETSNDEKIKDLEGTLEKKEKEYKMLEKNLNETAQKSVDLKITETSNKAEVKRLNGIIARSDEKIKDLKATTFKAEGEVKRLQDLLVTRDENIKDVAVTANNDRGEIQRLKSVLVTRDERIKYFERLQDLLEKRDQNVEVTANMDRGEIQRLKGVLVTRDESIKGFQVTTNNDRGEIQRLNGVLVTCDEMIKGFEVTTNNDRGEIQRLKNILVTRNESIKGFEGLNDIIRTRDDMIKDLEEYQQELETERIKHAQEQQSFRLFARVIQSTRKSSVSVGEKDETQILKIHNHKLKVDYIYPLNSSIDSICTSINDIVMNAVDGGKALIISHGSDANENWKIMFGTSDDTSTDTIMLKIFRAIMKQAERLQRRSYQANVSVKYRRRIEGVERHDCFSETIASPLTYENSILDGWRKLTKSEHSTWTRDGIAQLYVSKKLADKVISTGEITFATIASPELAKDCLKLKKTTSKFASYLQSVLSDDSSRKSVMILQLNERDEEKNKQIIEMIREVKEGKGGFNLFKTFSTK